VPVSVHRVLAVDSKPSPKPGYHDARDSPRPEAVLLSRADYPGSDLRKSLQNGTIGGGVQSALMDHPEPLNSLWM